MTFEYKDYADRKRETTLTLRATEFIRRFLQHVLPAGFQRIRQYGLLANRVRKERLELLRNLLGQRKNPKLPDPQEALPEPDTPDTAPPAEPSGDVCPVCKAGRMVPLGELPPDRELAGRVLAPKPLDTS